MNTAGNYMENKITYANWSNDAYSGQVNMTAIVYVNGDPVGGVDYVLYDKKLFIDDIMVKPEWRRKGFGSRLIKYIQQENPGYKYESSMKTDDGAKFIHKDLNLYENIKAKKIYEVLDFERGKDPIEAMDLGIPIYKDSSKLKKYCEELGYEFEHDKKDTLRINVPVNYREKHDYNSSNILYGKRGDFLTNAIQYTVNRPKGWEDSDTPLTLRKNWIGENGKPVKRNIIGRFNNINEIIRRLDTAIIRELEKSNNYNEISESLDFERGRDPKETMNIGIRSQILNGLHKLYNLGYDRFDIESPNPNKMIYSFVTFVWGTPAYRKDSSLIIDEIRNNLPNVLGEVTAKRVGYIWFEINPEYVDDFRRAYNDFSLGKSGDVSESLNFERGRDPKRSLRKFPIQGDLMKYGENRTDIFVFYEIHNNYIWFYQLGSFDYEDENKINFAESRLRKTQKFIEEFHPISEKEREIIKDQVDSYWGEIYINKIENDRHFKIII